MRLDLIFLPHDSHMSIYTKWLYHPSFPNRDDIYPGTTLLELWIDLFFIFIFILPKFSIGNLAIETSLHVCNTVCCVRKISGLFNQRYNDHATIQLQSLMAKKAVFSYLLKTQRASRGDRTPREVKAAVSFRCTRHMTETQRQKANDKVHGVFHK